VQNAETGTVIDFIIVSLPALIHNNSETKSAGRFKSTFTAFYAATRVYRYSVYNYTHALPRGCGNLYGTRRIRVSKLFTECALRKGTILCYLRISNT